MKNSGSGGGHQGGGRPRRLALHPGAEVVDAPQLVLRAPAGLERARQIADQVQAHGGRADVASGDRRRIVPEGASGTPRTPPAPQPERGPAPGGGDAARTSEAAQVPSMVLVISWASDVPP